MALDNQKKNQPLAASGGPASPLDSARGERQKIAKGYQEKIKEALSQPAKPITETKNQPLAKKTREAGSLSSNLDYPKIREAVLKELQSRPVAGAVALKTEPIKEAMVKEVIKDNPAREKIILPKLISSRGSKKYFVKKRTVPPAATAKKDVAPLTKVSRPKVILPKINRHFSFSLKRLLLTLFFTAIILFVVVSLGIYWGGWDQPLAKNISKIVPYPVLYVDGRLIFAKDFLADVDTLKQYSARQNSLVTDQEIRKQVLESLVEKAVLENLAKAQNIFIEPTEIKAEVDLILASVGTPAEAEQLIKDLYGWTLAQYQEKIIRPVLLAKKLETVYYQSGNFSNLKEQLSDYREQLIKEPEKFAAIAGQINEDATKFVGGDLGWFSLGDMVPEFEAVVLNLKAGELSEVFESRFGFHLVKLEEKIIEAGQPTFHASHLFLKYVPFSDYLSEQIKKAKVLTLIRI